MLLALLGLHPVPAAAESNRAGDEERSAGNARAVEEDRDWRCHYGETNHIGTSWHPLERSRAQMWMPSVSACHSRVWVLTYTWESRGEPS